MSTYISTDEFIMKVSNFRRYEEKDLPVGNSLATCCKNCLNYSKQYRYANGEVRNISNCKRFNMFLPYGCDKTICDFWRAKDD